jgi:hypothetical protein
MFELLPAKNDFLAYRSVGVVKPILPKSDGLARKSFTCKCGVRVMIVAERDLDKPTATLRVACPECGDAQMIDADRMISITREKGATTGPHSE